MAINFPSTPAIGDPYRYGIRTWMWNGTAWQLQINPSFGYGATTFPSDVTINGSLTVQGTQTNLNTTTYTVEDKNIIIGNVVGATGLSATLSTGTAVVLTDTTNIAPGQTLTKTTTGGGAFGVGAYVLTVDSSGQFTASVNHATAGYIGFNVGGATDVTAASGGITLKGATDKTILWDSASTSWLASENFNIPLQKTYKVAGYNALQGTGTQMILGSQATQLVIGGAGTTVTIPGTFSLGALTNPTIATGIQTTSTSFDFVPTTATNINIGRAATTIYAGSTGTNTFAIQGTTGTISFPSATSVTYSSQGTNSTVSFHSGSSVQHTMASNTYGLSIGGLQTAKNVTANIMHNATASGITKTINIGTSGVGGSVTNINFGSPTTNAQGTLAIQSNTFIGGFTSSPVQAITSATTITPLQALSFIQGTTAIATITAPTNISLQGGQITLIPQAAFTTTTGGNIAIASTAVAGRSMIMTYNPATTKWYPSY